METVVNLLDLEVYHPNMLFERNADLVAFFLSRSPAGVPGASTERVVAMEWTRRGEGMIETGMRVIWVGYPAEWNRRFSRARATLDAGQELVAPAACTMMGLCLAVCGGAESTRRVVPLLRGSQGDYWIRHPDHAGEVQVEASGIDRGTDADLRRRVRCKTGQVLGWGARSEGYVCVTMFEDTADGRVRSVLSYVDTVPSRKGCPQ